jgi:hypothetical protein
MGAKIRKVEHITKKLVSFFVETEYLLAQRAKRYEMPNEIHEEKWSD